MRVLVTAIAQPSGISGVQRHALNLVRCLLNRPEVERVHLVLAPWQQNLPALVGLDDNERVVTELADVALGSVSRNIWHLRKLPALARIVQADLVHLSYPVPVRRSAMPCPVVMTLHDLYPFEIPANFGFPQVIFNRWILRASLKRVDAITCVSQNTLEQLRQYGLGGEVERVVVPNCVERGPASSASSPLRGWNGELFLLAVAQHRRNKNLGLLMRSFARLLKQGLLPSSSILVVIGMAGPETPKLQKLAKQLNVRAQVQFREGLSDAELQWCYRHCAAVVAPSTTEGFGLPVAEARLAGCRVISSDIPAFRELAGPHVRTFSLAGDAERALCEAIEDILLEVKPGPEQLNEFSVQSIGSRYLELYKTVLNRSEHTVATSDSFRLRERQI